MVEKHRYQVGDIATLNAVVVGVTEGGNPIVKFNSGVRLLVKDSDITSVHPYDEPPKQDKRRGN